MLIEEVLFKTQHGLIDQSLHSRLGAETTNGDGFGLGWYGAGRGPGVYRSVAPAWGDVNLRHLAAHLESPLFMAHVRATSGSAVQEANCHPFAHDDWLFVHNGVVGGFPQMRRELMYAVDPSLFGAITGTTDSEVLFHLALTFGLLEGDPLLALERALGFVEETARAAGLAPAIQASIGVTDGSTVWALRYATAEAPRTLFVSDDIATLTAMHPEVARLRTMRGDDRLIVSEPFNDLPGAWREIEPSSAVVVSPGGHLEHRPFRPVVPTRTAR